MDCSMHLHVLCVLNTVAYWYGCSCSAARCTVTAEHCQCRVIFRKCTQSTSSSRLQGEQRFTFCMQSSLWCFQRSSCVEMKECIRLRVNCQTLFCVSRSASSEQIQSHIALQYLKMVCASWHHANDCACHVSVACWLSYTDFF